MRLHQYAVAIATACSFVRTLAAPVETAPEAHIEKRAADASTEHVKRINSQFRDADSNTKYFRKSFISCHRHRRVAMHRGCGFDLALTIYIR
jgi:hypothetical protein